MDLSMAITVMGFLIVVTNIVTEVLKKITYNIIPTELLTVFVAQCITIGAYVSYIKCIGAEASLQSNFSAVVAGFLVSYGAMFGFDKLKAALEKFYSNK